MPLPVPYHPQIAEGYCLAASAQMVLHYWGISSSQTKIAQQLGIISGAGIPASRIQRLQSNRLDIHYRHGDWDELTSWLSQDVPIIALVQAGELSHWRGQYFQHAIVITGYDDTNLFLLDPANAAQQLTVTIDEFMLAWGEIDYLYAVITPK